MTTQPKFVSGTHVPSGFIRGLARQESNALGFLSDEAIDWYTHKGMVIGGTVNNDPTCFALGKLGTATYADAACVYMTAVRNDARRLQHASWLLRRIEAAGRERSLGRVQLWCRAGLEANELWYALGMQPLALRAGGTGRGLPQICWVKQFDGRRVTADVLSQRRRGRAGRPLAIATAVTAAEVIDASRNAPEEMMRLTADASRLTIARIPQMNLFPEAVVTPRSSLVG